MAMIYNWKKPKCLQKTAANVVAETTFRVAIKKARVSQDLLAMKKATEKEHVNNLKELLSEVEMWWKRIPGISGKLGETLKVALDDATELYPLESFGATDHILSLLFKLTLLDSVFIDKDYANSCGLCSIPFSSESIVVSVLKQRTFRIHKLTIYGPLYPTITETIVANSGDLRYLAISHMNLTDDLMRCIAECTKLEVLHLMHNYIWLAVSRGALCTGFFNGLSEDYVADSFQKESKLAVSFPYLKVLDIGPCTNKFVSDLYSWVLYYYDISSFCLEWKACLLEEERKLWMERVIFPLVQKGKLFQLESLCISVDFLSAVTSHNLHLIANSFPKLNQICLDCNVRNSYRTSCQRAAEKLRRFADKAGTISKLYINISKRDKQTLAIVEPFLTDFGEGLVTLILTSDQQGHFLNLETLHIILKLCPNLRQLKLMFLNRYSLRYPDSNSFHFPDTKLRELWFHEISPWDLEQGLSHELYVTLWIKTLTALIRSSPLLDMLSLTVCESMSKLLSELSSSVTCFHLHFKDGCEWNVEAKSIVGLVARFDRITHFYLEELDGQIYWQVRNHFRASDLNVFWGNFGGWPRT